MGKTVALETMTLQEMVELTKRLQKTATKKFVGKLYNIPLFKLEEEEGDELIEARVKSIDLQEDAVELRYEMEGVGTCWSLLTVEEFTMFAEPLR